MDNSIENMHTDVGALRVNKRKKTTNRLTHQSCTYISLVANQKWEFSLDLYCLSAGGGERLCTEIWVIKFSLLMSG